MTWVYIVIQILVIGIIYCCGYMSGKMQQMRENILFNDILVKKIFDVERLLIRIKDVTEIPHQQC